MTHPPVKVGLIGCGPVSSRYLQTVATLPGVEVVTLADLNPERAITQAVESGVARANNPDQILSDPDIELILNLTTPKAHTGITLAALRASKHVFSEQPLAIEREDGQKILEAARERDRLVGCAPDTFLGAGWQTARQVVEEQAVGEIVGGVVTLLDCAGQTPTDGGPLPGRDLSGPLLRLGPYYLTALVHLFGPIRRVSAAARAGQSDDVPDDGQPLPIDGRMHLAGTLEFDSGLIVSIVASSEVAMCDLPAFELYGTSGTLSLPDPWHFGGPLRIRRAGENEWQEVALTKPYVDDQRGLGLGDMAHALRTGRPHRASGELAFHVLDVLHTLLDSAAGGQQIEPASTCTRPPPLPGDLVAGMFDD